jgi:transcription-repair coupling factor (superfamily II helicase)
VRHPGDVEALGREMEDRFGPLPQEAKRLLDAARLRILGRAVGVERILLQGRSARLSFRAGVVPRVAALDAPLSSRQVTLEVRRMEPLSVVLQQLGTMDLGETVVAALTALNTGGSGDA